MRKNRLLLPSSDATLTDMQKVVYIGLAFLMLTAAVCPRLCAAHSVAVAKHDCCPESKTPAPQKSCCEKHVTDLGHPEILPDLPIALMPLANAMPAVVLISSVFGSSVQIVASTGPPIYLINSTFLI